MGVGVGVCKGGMDSGSELVFFLPRRRLGFFFSCKGEGGKAIFLVRKHGYEITRGLFWLIYAGTRNMRYCM